MLSRTGAPTTGIDNVRPSTRAKALTGRLLLLARTVLLLLLVSVIAGMFPFQPWSPSWYLRLSQLFIDYSPALLLGLTLLLLAAFFEPNAERSSQQLTHGRRLTGLTFWVYGVLIPLQLMSFGWLWIKSATQTRVAISNAETQVSPIRTRINAANDEANLLAIVGKARPLPSAPANRPSLATQKREFLTDLDRDLGTLRSNLTRQRNQQLAAALLSTLRAAIGAAVLATAMLALKRQL